MGRTMATRFEDRATSRRRYVRVTGPFEGRQMGPRPTPVLIYDLNVGGGFVHFVQDSPKEETLFLKIVLPEQEPVTVKAETVYRHPSGVAVRFVDVDDQSQLRLTTAIDSLVGPHSGG